MWFVAGWVAVAIGGIGVVVPGLPTTVFFIIAASCFARSSPRFERWVLNLPKVGPLVRDHRAGLGMPRRAKMWAVGMMVVFAGASAVMASHPALSLSIAGLAAIGAWYVISRVPTRERVLASQTVEPAGGAPTA
ncbi:MAG: YbaN family protein [Acidimicrobiia bacterium]